MHAHAFWTQSYEVKSLLCMYLYIQATQSILGRKAVIWQREVLEDYCQSILTILGYMNHCKAGPNIQHYDGSVMWQQFFECSLINNKAWCCYLNIQIQTFEDTQKHILDIWPRLTVSCISFLTCPSAHPVTICLFSSSIKRLKRGNAV